MARGGPGRTGVMAGDAETGVTIMVMDEGLTRADPRPTANADHGSGHGGSLRDRLSEMGRSRWSRHFRAAAGTSSRAAARRSDSCSAPRTGRSHHHRPHARDRSVEPHPRPGTDIGAQLEIEGVTHKILEASPYPLAGSGPASTGARRRAGRRRSRDRDDPTARETGDERRRLAAGPLLAALNHRRVRTGIGR